MVVERHQYKEEGKMSHYQHLTTGEREKAMVWQGQGCSIRKIAGEINRSPSTISRELRRNSRADGTYSAEYATKKYRKRRKACAPKHIMSNPIVAEYVTERLLLKWTPEQIAGRAKLEGFPVRFSFVTIYRAIDGRVLPYALKKEMRFKSKYKRHKAGGDDKRREMQGIKSIHDRPAGANDRSELGHWESDTVLGMRKTGAIATHVDRKTGFLVAAKLQSGSSSEYMAATISAFANIPRRARKTFTVDRGKEFTDHEELKTKLEMPVFFCDPYSPWQRGTNENTNGLLRQFFPKKTSFASISDDILALAVTQINNRPRKRLAWSSPAELFLRPTPLLHLA
jgi:IS30 family transposase